MKKIKLTEKDLQRIVKRVIKEHNDNEVGESINEISGGGFKPGEKERIIDSLLDRSDDYTREELEKLSFKDLLNAFKKSYDHEKEMDHIGTQLKEEFDELMGYIVYEYENVTKDDINYAADNDGIFEELKGYFDAVEELEDWVEENDYGGELMEEAMEVVDMLTTYLPYHIEVKKDPEIEELLSKYESWRYKK